MAMARSFPALTAVTPRRLLIVDDNPLARADAKAALLKGSNRPYLFVEASSAAEGLLRCGEAPLPDCLVLDLGLPDASELDVLARLPRGDDQLLRVPVVVLTSSVQRGLSHATKRAGANDYVSKAWLGPQTLTQAVDNAIERLAMARRLHLEREAAESARLRALQLESENRQIQEASRLKSQFLADMSHELRTPLSVIVGFADLLGSGMVQQGSQQQQVFLGHIGRSGRELLRLLNDVLDLSKVEAGKLAFRPQPVDLRALVEEVQLMFAQQLKHKRLGLCIDVEAGLGRLVLDPMRLKQVLNNYLSNAIKFTAAGGRIGLRARGEGAQQFRIEIQDNGIGIAADDLPRLFTQYQQLDASDAREDQGAGLGLALVRRLVQAQGGTVGVHSQPGQGSVFYLVLNRVHAASRVEVALTNTV